MKGTGIEGTCWILLILCIALTVTLITTVYERRAVRVIMCGDGETKQRCVSCENVAVYAGNDTDMIFCPYCGRKFTKTIVEDGP